MCTRAFLCHPFPCTSTSNQSSCALFFQFFLLFFLVWGIACLSCDFGVCLSVRPSARLHVSLFGSPLLAELSFPLMSAGGVSLRKPISCQCISVYIYIVYSAMIFGKREMYLVSWHPIVDAGMADCN